MTTPPERNGPRDAEYTVLHAATRAELKEKIDEFRGDGVLEWGRRLSGNDRDGWSVQVRKEPKK